MQRSTTTAPGFALDPTLPWLFSDPTMQEPAALRGMETLTLGEEAYEPMALYFPPGTQLAMRRVTSLDQLQEGAAYWQETHYEQGQAHKVSRCFGRYAGLAFPEAKSTARRWKLGEAHLTLEADVLDCHLSNYLLREDGTTSCFVDVKANKHQLYQITHYVNLPASYLAQLGPEAIKQTGLTLRQATWLRQEKELLTDAVEITSRMLGGLNLPDYRVVLDQELVSDFNWVQESLPHLTPGQARRCKSEVLVTTYRSRRNAVSCADYLCTEYFRLEDAAPLLDWLRYHSDLQRLQLDAAIAQQTIGHTAAALRTKHRAELASRHLLDTPAFLDLPYQEQRQQDALREELSCAA